MGTVGCDCIDNVEYKGLVGRGKDPVEYTGLVATGIEEGTERVEQTCAVWTALGAAGIAVGTDTFEYTGVCIIGIEGADNVLGKTCF